jgi:hypothetical protein
VSKGIQFELRPRRKTHDFWSVRYDTADGRILGIEPGDVRSHDRLTVSYPKIKDILSGQQNQENYVVAFDEKIGSLDLVDARKSHQSRKKQNWKSWLSSTVFDQEERSDLKFVLFNDGMIRLESSRLWSTSVSENPNRAIDFPVYITAADDPHMFLGCFKVSTSEIIEKGYSEKRLYSFVDANTVDDILNDRQAIRVNVPPIAETLSLVRLKKYFSFTGIIDDQTSISHPGPGRHITLFVKNNAVWAQSHYHPGSPLGDLIGPLRAGMFQGEPDNFLGWVEFPPLMLRQTSPFELISNWYGPNPPDLLYKANNLDIGVVK